MKVRIQAVVDSSHKPVYDFGSATITIGRDAGCDLPMTGTGNVSGRHAQIALAPDGASLIDLESTNGTFLNDRRIDGRKKVRKGDYFRLGQTGPCFQIVELDLTGPAAPPVVVGTSRERGASSPSAYEPEPEYRAPAPRPPIPQARPVPEAPQPAMPTRPVPTAMPGQTRLMVVELQKKNRNLMLSVGVAVVVLILVGGTSGLFLIWKQAALSSKTADLDDAAKKQHEKMENLDQAVTKVAKGDDKPTGQQISDKLRRSTVWINTSPDATGMYSTGSGMLVNAEEKIVVTNYHVVARPRVSRLKDLPGQLTNADFDKQAKLYAKAHSLKLPAKIIRIDLQSLGFDCQMQVQDAKGTLLEVSDDRMGGRQARIHFNAAHEGDYRIVVISRNGVVGNYKLAVSQIIHDVHPLVDVIFPDYADGKPIIEKDYYRNLFMTEKEKYKAKVIGWSDAKDLAILKLNYVPAGIGAVPLAKEGARSGQDVHSIGNPGTSKFLWIYTSGTVRTADANRAKYLIPLHSGEPFLVDAWIIETQSPINGGDSGGPVVNDRGEMVAVTHAQRPGAYLASTFIDIREVRALLKDNNIRWQEK